MIDADPWWAMLLSLPSATAVIVRAVFPQDSADRLAWWRDRRRHRGCGPSRRARAADQRQADLMEPRAVVESPGRDDGWHVRVGTEIIGVAYGPRDVLEALQRAGAVEDVDQVDLVTAD
ncbi:hypothetical protein ACFO3J_20635 [Streptomyces polygonati]|uniref:Uncharacterized protein n=1 Tax=Streptomyces polygonati TaxID=1617087 RepID=A0ABV8HSC0_9ACTN